MKFLQPSCRPPHPRAGEQGPGTLEGSTLPYSLWIAPLTPHIANHPAPFLPTGIIDLSQVPHLPVLVPPTPGTPATAMDRLAYLPTAPQHFSSRLSSSPLSPGNASPHGGWGPGGAGRVLCGPWGQVAASKLLGFQEAPLT